MILAARENSLAIVVGADQKMSFAPSSAFMAAASAITDRATSGIWFAFRRVMAADEALILFCHLDKLFQCRKLTGRPQKWANDVSGDIIPSFWWPSVLYGYPINPYVYLRGHPHQNVCKGAEERRRPLCLNLSGLEPRKIGWLF